ncbi:MAG: hypothetical protein N2C14_16605 [Planctomycetales bacterium]
MAELDVYRDWLEITDAERPLNHYQLLKLKTFEDDAKKVRKNYRKLNGHVRKYASGKYAEESQQLLNELAKAMLALTDAQRKREYDATLGRAVKRGGRRQTFEELLLSSKAVTPEQLKKARTLADAVGLELRDAVVQQKAAPQEIVMQAFAESEGLPYLELADVELSEDLLARVPAVLARQHSCAPVMIDQDQMIMASPNPLGPDVEDDLRVRLGMHVRLAICTAASIHEVINQHYSREKAQAEIAQQRGQQAVAKQDEDDDEETGSGEEKKDNRAVFAFAGFAFSFLITHFLMGGQLIWMPVPLAVGGVVAGVLYSFLSSKRK